MYLRRFEDPDGRAWEPLWMDAEAAAGEMPMKDVAA